MGGVGGAGRKTILGEECDWGWKAGRQTLRVQWLV